MVRFGMLVLGGGLVATAALADHDTHLGPLARQVEGTLTAPWQGWEEGGWYVLRNDSKDDGELALSVQAGQPSANGRRTVANVSLISNQGTASIGIYLENTAANGFCLVEVTAAREGILFCNENGNHRQIARVPNAGFLNGQDVVEIIEQPGYAKFSINGRMIGEVRNSPALGADIGLMTYDMGTFGVTKFAITDLPGQSGTASSGGEVLGSAYVDPDQLSQILGDATDVVVNTTVRQGWSIGIDNGWFVMDNPSAENDTFGYVIDVGEPSPGGRAISIYAAVQASQGMANANSASAGIVLQNKPANASCIGEITGAGEGLLTCFEGDNTTEVARVPGLAKMDGTDVVALLQVPGAAQFLVNDQVVGDVIPAAAPGTTVGIAAYNKGRFFLSGFNVTDFSEMAGTTSSAPSAPVGNTGTSTTPASGTGAANVAGNGPLPMFGGDAAVITAVYLGMTQSILLHEFGHALIGELQLPSTGPEEDAVDIYSALGVSDVTTRSSGNSEDDALNAEIAKYAALQWYYSGIVSAQRGQGVPWQDEHTADLKRFRNMFCVMYGANPRVFEGVAQQAGFDERTLSRCEDEFVKQNRAWRSILAQHTRVSALHPEGMLRADAPGARISISFENSSTKVGNFVREILGQGILQDYVAELEATYAVPRDLPITFKDCQQLNAWYDPREGTITFCYELLEDLAVMISDVESGNIAASVPAGGALPVAASGAAAPMDEMADMGIPATQVLFPAPYNGPTPTAIPGAQLARTEDVARIVGSQGRWLLVGTRGTEQTIPNAVIVTDAGRDGSLTDGFQGLIGDWLTEQTAGDRSMTVIFFGTGPLDRSAYNAALRAGKLGYTNIMWYRGGMEAWVAKGNQLGAPQN